MKDALKTIRFHYAEKLFLLYIDIYIYRERERERLILKVETPKL